MNIYEDNKYFRQKRCSSSLKKYEAIKNIKKIAIPTTNFVHLPQFEESWNEIKMFQANIALSNFEIKKIISIVSQCNINITPSIDRM